MFYSIDYKEYFCNHDDSIKKTWNKIINSQKSIIQIPMRKNEILWT